MKKNIVLSALLLLTTNSYAELKSYNLGPNGYVNFSKHYQTNSDQWVKVKLLGVNSSEDLDMSVWLEKKGVIGYQDCKPFNGTSKNETCLINTREFNDTFGVEVKNATSSYANFYLYYSTLEEYQCSDLSAEPYKICPPFSGIEGAGSYSILDDSIRAWHETPNSSKHVNSDKYAQDWNYGGASDDLGKNLYAAISGTVIYAGYHNSEYGNQVIIYDYNRKLALRYSHMQSYDVSVNSAVSAGDFIGKVGNSGTKYVHLHLSLHKDISINSAAYYELLNGNRPVSEKYAAQFNIYRP